MVQTWIDRLARQVAATTTRRGLARLGLGGALAGLALGEEDALAACKAPKKKCAKGNQCCSGKCKKGKCGQCAIGQTFCAGACVDTQSSTAHCGGCGVACGAGQRCVNGTCTCDGAACAGCCDGATCQAGTTDQFCGANGGACVACAADQDCVNRACACTAASCPSGCCDGTTCRPGTADQFCGKRGNACTSCAADQQCVIGSCTCTPASCPSGCCDGDTCQAGTSDQICGTGGGTCTACRSYQTCSNGVCVSPPCGAGGPCWVFVTSSWQLGNLGGIAGADTLCRTLAARANLPGSTTYFAWLSDNTVSPASRFNTSTVLYQLVNGTTIANDWSDLTDGSLAGALNVTELGEGGVNRSVYTNTLANGTVRDGNSCANWTTTDGATGLGATSRGDHEWTDHAFGNCSSRLPIYCFQQP